MIQSNDIPLKATKLNRKQFVLKLVAVYSLNYQVLVIVKKA